MSYDFAMSSPVNTIHLRTRKKNPTYFLMMILQLHAGQKSHYIHQLTTMLSNSKNVLFPGQNHLLTTGADDPSL